jgi:hypothetical protein
MPSSGMWRRVGLVKTDVSKERVASIFRIEKIYASEEKCYEAPNRLSSIPSKLRFLQDPHGITSQNTTFLRLMFVFERYFLRMLQHKRKRGRKERQ